VTRALRVLWRFLREVSGDAAYEAYLRQPGRGPTLSRKQFYLDTLRRKYTRPTRCC
jgi:hypothetical protein